MNSFLDEQIFSRTLTLVGAQIFDKISKTRVILFGVGGVGSWCAESLVRSGIRNLTIVDSDTVNVTNINRQLMATTQTIGALKVDALKERLLQINPLANINAIGDIFDENNCNNFELNSYDIIIDAIDSLENKMRLLLESSKTKAKVYSSMGAALKIDPTRIKVAEFWDVKGCPLARALRDKFKKKKLKPHKKIKCVYSDELLKNLGCVSYNNAPKEFHKVAVNGTMAHITAIFGFTLAGLILNDLYKKQ